MNPQIIESSVEASYHHEELGILVPRVWVVGHRHGFTVTLHHLNCAMFFYQENLTNLGSHMTPWITPR